MNAVFRILISFIVGLAVFPVHAAETDGPVPPSFLSANAPGDITELYLRFHEKELCGDVHALFVYDGNGLKVWCRARDEGSYDRLMKLIKPLSADYSVETYSSTLYPDKSSEDRDTLPPSLWENSRLRDYLLFPFADTPLGDEFDTPLFIDSPSDLYRRRLRLFLDQTLRRGSELERIAAELPELTRMGTDHSLCGEMESLAARVCMDHCRELEKLAERLRKSLEQALPGDAKDMDAGNFEPEPGGECDIQVLADRIYISSHRIFRSVHAFLYPEQHTVQVEELRRPGILVSLAELNELLGEYLHRMK